MRTMRFLTAGVLAFAATAGFARAADMVDEVPQAPAPVFEEAPRLGWAGAYGGVYGGYGTGTYGQDVDIGANGFQGGVFGGYNMQNDGIVYGLDSDVGYGGAKGNVGAVEAKKGFNGALRARLGYDLGPAMIYGAAGGTAASVKATDGLVDDTRMHLGYTVGAGIDAKVTDNVFVRGDYRYNVFNDKNYALTAPANVDLKQHDIRLGLGLKF